MSLNEKNIFKTAKPLYLVCKFSGFACFSIKGNSKDGKIQSKFYDILLFILFCCFYINNIYMSLEVDSYYGTSVILDIGNYTSLFVSIMAALLFVVTSFLQRHNIWSILKSLNQFDQHIELLGISIDHEKHKKNLIIFILTTGTLKAMHICFLIYDVGTLSLKHLFFIFLPNVSFFVQIGTMQLILMSIKLRQNHLIRCIENVFQLDNDRVRYVRNNGINQIINSISYLYDKINEVVEAFNKSFCFASVVCFTLYFAYSVFSTFTVSRSLGYKEITMYFIMKTSFLAIFYTSYVLAVIHFASKVGAKV